MNKNIYIILSIIFNLFILALLYADNVSRNEFVRVTYFEGDGIINHGFNKSEEAISVNAILTEGDFINSYEKTKVELMFGNGVLLRINENTNLQLLSLSQSKGVPIIIKLISGDIIIDSSISAIQENNFRIDMLDCSVYLVQEGYFRVIYTDYSDIMVYRGAVEVATENNSFSLSSGQRLFNAGSPGANPEFFNTFSDDEFSRWNEYRQNYYNNKRVPREYAGEINQYDLIELEEYGDWRYEPSYGYVWVPYIAGGWRPYLYGEWVWFPSGWAWVSYEPWGWAPYHYGRWGFSISIGWFWIPRPIFGLAWVSWYTWDDYIGWCPLDYYDRPIFFDPPSNNGYYRPNLKSWTIIPKSKLGSKDLHKYRINEIEKFNTLKINKENILKHAEFNIRPKNLPEYKKESLPNSKIEQKEGYMEYYKKPMEKYNKDIKIYNKNYDRSEDSSFEFRKFKENLDKYNANRSQPNYESRKSYNYKPERNYPSYEQWREREPQSKDYYKSHEYNREVKPREEIHNYDKPYYEKNRTYEPEHYYKSITPSYREEAKKIFENIYKGRTESYHSSTSKGSKYYPSEKPHYNSKPAYKKKD